jgi:hypothetical protein
MAKPRTGKAKIMRQAARVGVAAKQGRCKAALFHYTVLVRSAERAGRMHDAQLPRVRATIHRHCMR